VAEAWRQEEFKGTRRVPVDIASRARRDFSGAAHIPRSSDETEAHASQRALRGNCFRARRIGNRQNADERRGV